MEGWRERKGGEERRKVESGDNDEWASGSDEANGVLKRCDGSGVVKEGKV